jgi:hypothetical protein
VTVACKVQVKIYDDTGKRVYVREVQVPRSDTTTAKDVEGFLDAVSEEEPDGPDEAGA